MSLTSPESEDLLRRYVAEIAAFLDSIWPGGEVSVEATPDSSGLTVVVYLGTYTYTRYYYLGATNVPHSWDVIADKQGLHARYMARGEARSIVKEILKVRIP